LVFFIGSIGPVDRVLNLAHPNRPEKYGEVQGPTIYSHAESSGIDGAWERYATQISTVARFRLVD